MVNNIRNFYYLLKQIFILFKNSGSLKFNSEIGCFVCKKKINGVEIILPVRSRKILTRINNFGSSNDIVFDWIKDLSNVKNFLDIGSANGLEGIFVHNKYGCKVIFIEMYIPSLDDLLKIQYLCKEKKVDIEIFQGAITSKSSLSKVYNHSPPKSGGTFNSYDTKRSPFFFKKQKIETSYWSSGLSIDDFLLRTTLDFPSHVKIDVDGYESEIIKGCLKLLKSRKVKEYMIEMCSDSEKFIYKTMKSYGYVEIKKGMHKNGNWDSLFVKKNNKS